VLTQDTWKKIQVNYIYYPLKFLLEDKSLDRNYFYHIVQQFVEKAEKNDMMVSIDHVFAFMRHLSFSHKISTLKNPAELLAEYAKREGILATPMGQPVFPSRKLLHKLSQLNWKEENHSFFVFLHFIPEKLVQLFLEFFL
jgi:hypothetical protein